MIKLYYHPSPNPAKIVLFLEEAGLEYDVVPVDTWKGEQFAPDFLAINPNGKTPALTDDGVPVFDSTAILLHLARKTGMFLADADGAEHAQMLSWLMFVASGIGPYSGQAVHFRLVAPKPKDYAVNRYTFEAERHWGLLDARLARSRFMAGETYSIADMAVWGWGTSPALSYIFGPEAWSRFPNVKRLVDELNARPAAQRAAALPGRFGFKREMDQVARDSLFPQNKQLTSSIVSAK